MNYIDIVIGILLLASFVLGWRQGLVRQAFGILALLSGVYCAYKFSDFTAHCLSKWFELNAAVTGGVAFAVTFIAVLFLVILIGRIADRFIKMVALGFVNRLLGAILCTCKAVLIISVCVVILHSFDALPKGQIRSSALYQPMKRTGDMVFPYLASIKLKVE
ncbi:MAG: CvpA family protein, partial [Prevotellaceae bacterium]|nr:CvpA family protein [Prevotellaceae bacterium]